MEKIKITYDGDLRTNATHLRSGSEIATDAPVDNKGKGENFSPTDLFATSLGACMLTIMGITAQTHGFCIDGSTIELQKKMSANPRRVSDLTIIINIKGELSDRDKTKLMRAAEHCPVSKSIHPDINENINFHFEKN